MAQDPAFLFYDGDAARDVSHMNRLERGCYFDLIQAQRKFGKLPIDLIKKILGKDFESCWDTVKICLTYENHMYFIAWLHDSSEKRKAYSESRKNNRNAKKVPETDDISQSYVNHMENANENAITTHNINSLKEEKKNEKNNSKQWLDIMKKIKEANPDVEHLKNL